MHGLEAVESKSEAQSPVDRVVGIAQVLNSYGDHFDLPKGWEAIKLSH